LVDVVAVNDAVLFHAALIDDSLAIQYLASSVWLKKDDRNFADHRPMPIKRENIRPQKIEIYKMVIFRRIRQCICRTIYGPEFVLKVII
jgi:hypothetical protein